MGGCGRIYTGSEALQYEFPYVFEWKSSSLSLATTWNITTFILLHHTNFQPEVSSPAGLRARILSGKPWQCLQ